MPKRKPSAKRETSDALSRALDSFDFAVECDDFLLYELGRLIEEDNASFENEELRRLIGEGIQQHIETRLVIRAALAGRIRSVCPGTQDPLHSDEARLVEAIEDTDYSLRDFGIIVRAYTAYLFRQLQECSGRSTEGEERARKIVERFQHGEISLPELAAHLRAAGSAAIAPLADLLFDSLDDREITETAIEVLASVRCQVSARVLAHLISEPMLDEDLEARTYDMVKRLWPLPQPYILFLLKSHVHEDLPFRWFQLLIDCSDLSAVERILEEVVMHAENSNFQEDLLALLELLRRSQDPETENKILEVLNRPETSRNAAIMLENFVKSFSQQKPAAGVPFQPWAALPKDRGANRQYLAAAKLFDRGNVPEARRKLEELLKENPEYPFGLMLKALIGG